MTPKEKAIELIEKFATIRANVHNSFCKESALIAVNELINSTQPKSRMFRYDEYCIEYWQEVKIEIEKL